MTSSRISDSHSDEMGYTKKTGKNQLINSYLKILIQGYLPQRNGGEKKKISKGNISHFNTLYKERRLKENLAGNFIPLNF